MAVNLDKPHLWKQDTQASVDYYNTWFMEYAPKAFRETRIEVTKQVEAAIAESDSLLGLSAELLKSHPGLLPTLRMACCPPLAVDRLVGLAYTSKRLVGSLEKGKIAAKMAEGELAGHLTAIVRVIGKLLDPDILVWLPDRRKPTRAERFRASTIIADRLTGAVANPIIKNAQEKRQLAKMEAYLKRRGYQKKSHPPGAPLDSMAPGTFTFHYSVSTGGGKHKVAVSVDAMIQPRQPRPDGLPILVEAKSAGDFTNTNKRRKEESKKFSQLKATLGESVCYIVFLCGYFDGGYLGYEAQDGIDWVWEHRMDDFGQLGI
jgi:hypothetical protein